MPTARKATPRRVPSESGPPPWARVLARIARPRARRVRERSWMDR
jgi:hypothetical protein